MEPLGLMELEALVRMSMAPVWRGSRLWRCQGGRGSGVAEGGCEGNVVLGFWGLT